MSTPGVLAFCISVNWIQLVLNVLTFCIALEEFFRVYVIRYAKTRISQCDETFWFHFMVIFHPFIRSLASIFLEHACVPLSIESIVSRIFLSVYNYLFTAAFVLIIVKWSQLVHKHRSGRKKAYVILVTADIIFCGVIPLVLTIVIAISARLRPKLHPIVALIELIYYTLLNASLAVLFAIYGIRAQFVVKKLLKNRLSLSGPSSSSDSEPVRPNSHLRLKLFVQTLLALICFLFRTCMYFILSLFGMDEVSLGVLGLLKDGIGDSALTIILLFMNIPAKTYRKKKRRANASTSRDEIGSVRPAERRKSRKTLPNEQQSLLINTQETPSEYSLFYRDQRIETLNSF
ncbi:hypothetical protein BLNAU_5712 [Blattamonas nauphoetae]|uniref:Uncharacterized protein n=1 Tax=Blattamonas nauphoetae TaxID=2049346 RepID=A0ABQ9Y6R1_9EUKA|nr:hypothetical protein BLNAU_5712 [Blattamonas nauphoetae]